MHSVTGCLGASKSARRNVCFGLLISRIFGPHAGRPPLSTTVLKECVRLCTLYISRITVPFLRTSREVQCRHAPRWPTSMFIGDGKTLINHRRSSTSWGCRMSSSIEHSGNPVRSSRYCQLPLTRPYPPAVPRSSVNQVQSLAVPLRCTASLLHFILPAHNNRTNMQSMHMRPLQPM